MYKMPLKLENENRKMLFAAFIDELIAVNYCSQTCQVSRNAAFVERCHERQLQYFTHFCHAHTGWAS